MSRAKYSALEKLTFIEEFRKSGMPRRTFAREYGINKDLFKRWVDRYDRDGIEGLQEARHNNHYSKALKLEAVLTYLTGQYSQADVALKFGLRSQKQLLDWVSKYNEDKTVTASPSKRQVPIMSRKTSFEERVSIVEYITKDKHSYNETAKHFGISYQQARSWVLKVRQGGYESLIDNRGHRKNQSELTDLDKANLRIRELESQIEDQKLYAAFIKKWQELQRKG